MRGALVGASPAGRVASITSSRGASRTASQVGNRFRSLQYPAVKYGILRVLDVLSLFPYAVNSRSFQDMLDLVHDKAVSGRYNVEMADAVYVEFDFGKLGEPSRWLTFLVNRIDKRVDELS